MYSNISRVHHLVEDHRKYLKKPLAQKDETSAMQFCWSHRSFVRSTPFRCLINRLGDTALECVGVRPPEDLSTKAAAVLSVRVTAWTRTYPSQECQRRLQMLKSFEGQQLASRATSELADIEFLCIIPRPLNVSAYSLHNAVGACSGPYSIFYPLLQPSAALETFSPSAPAACCMYLCTYILPGVT